MCGAIETLETWCQLIFPDLFFFKSLNGDFHGGRTVRASKLIIHLSLSFWNYSLGLPLFYYLRLSCIAAKGNFQSPYQKKPKPFSSVCMKYFKTEGKESCFLFGFFFSQGELSNMFQFGRKPSIKILKFFGKSHKHCLKLLWCYLGLYSLSQHRLSI